MKRALLSFFASGICLAAIAIPAKPGWVKFTQPGGTDVEIKILGDEHGHIAYSKDGLVVLDAGGRLEYAKFNPDGMAVPSGILVSSSSLDVSVANQIQSSSQIDDWIEFIKANRDLRLDFATPKRFAAISSDDSVDYADNAASSENDENADNDENRVVPLNFGRCESTFPVLGEQRGLVVLVEYEDVQFTYGDYDYFYRMLNEEGFSDFGSLGSCRDWFVENSNGQFLPDFDVYGPVTLPNKRSFYGGNDVFGNDKNPQKMAIHALDILDDEVDFTQYDRDGDGKIDNVFIFYAGKGEHDSNVSNAVWPHSWDVSSAESDTTYVYDGVVLDHYACTCEYPSGYQRPDGIGTFVHEFSHVMGLPDLYVTTYTGGFTSGPFSVLDYGPYNNDRLTPPNYSSYEKCALGWIDLIPMEEGNIELPNFSDSNVAYVLPTERANEFYFFENRQLVGNDAYIPYHGMLVWRIDYAKTYWTMNTVNNTSSHQRVDLIEADNKKTEATRNGDPFPGVSGVTEFTFETTPKLSSWLNKPLEFDIKNIEETDDGLIRFDAVARYVGPSVPDQRDDEPIGIGGGNASSDPGDPNSVGSLDSESTENAVYYDLMGRKISNPQNGIYIRNGRKVLVK